MSTKSRTLLSLTLLIIGSLVLASCGPLSTPTGSVAPTEPAGEIVPESTSREPNQSTATTEEKMVKIAKNVRTARARVEARAA